MNKDLDGLYKEHKDLLMIIFRIGNKVAIQKQLREICLKLELYKDKNHFNRVIDSLEENELIERKEFRGTNNRILILKNPIISYLATDTELRTGYKFDKTSVGKKLTTDRINTSMYKLEWIIRLLNSKVAIKYNIKNTEVMFDYLEKNTTILFSKHKGLELIETFNKHNKANINLQPDECKEIIEEMKIEKTKRQQGVPSKTGKTKEKNKNKLNDTIKGNKFATLSKEPNEFKNDFNSFLERNAFLRFVSHKEEIIKTTEGKNVKNRVLTFTLYILDVKSTLNYQTLGNRINKTYTLLKETYGKEQYFGKERCDMCEKNINSKNYIQIKNSNIYVPKDASLEAQRKALKYCVEGNDIHLECPKKPEYYGRKIHLNVEVITWDEGKKADLQRKCLIHGKTAYSKEPKLFPNLKDSILGDKTISQAEFEENIKIKYIDFNFSTKYLNVNATKNIDKYNEKVKEQKTKEKLATKKILELEELGLLDEFKKFLLERNNTGNNI